jgi:AbrB family looped-hinge helix DNA binding protein
MAGKISTKGQVTIPQELRDRLGFVPGTRVEFEASGDEILIRRTAEGSTRARAWLERATGSASVAMTTDEIMALTRGE